MTLPVIEGAPEGLVAEIWERDEYRMKPWITNGTPVVDVGAFVGVFSLWAASLGAHVVAVEPHRPSYEILRRNTAGAVVAPLWAAVGAESGRCGLVERGFGGYTEPGGDIPVLPLSWFYGDDVVMKMDCEGAEYDALIGADLSFVAYLALEFHLWTVVGDDPVEGWGRRAVAASMIPDPVRTLIEWLERTHDVTMNGHPDRGGYLYAERR